MPLPVSHSLLGSTLFVALDEDGGGCAWPRLLAAITLANAPDLDLLPGLLLGDPNRFHRGASHSLVVAVLAGLVLGLVADRVWGWRWPLRGVRAGAAATALMLGLLLGSHALLDALTEDPSPPHGEQLLWPLSDSWVRLYPLFDRADKVSGPASPAQFARSLISVHNARAVAWEALLLGPPLALALWWRRRRPPGG